MYRVIFSMTVICCLTACISAPAPASMAETTPSSTPTPVPSSTLTPANTFVPLPPTPEIPHELE